MINITGFIHSRYPSKVHDPLRVSNKSARAAKQVITCRRHICVKGRRHTVHSNKFTREEGRRNSCPSTNRIRLSSYGGVSTLLLICLFRTATIHWLNEQLTPSRASYSPYKGTHWLGGLHVFINSHGLGTFSKPTIIHPQTRSTIRTSSLLFLRTSKRKPLPERAAVWKLHLCNMNRINQSLLSFVIFVVVSLLMQSIYGKFLKFDFRYTPGNIYSLLLFVKT